MNTFPLSITAVDQVYFDGEASAVTCPGSEGEMTILANHEPFVSVLKSGTVTVQSGEEKKEFQIEKGILEVNRDGAVILL